jgi:hypothetical protein
MILPVSTTIGLDDLGAQRSGLPTAAASAHRRVAGQTILDLAGTDAVARRRDDVVVAAEEMDIASLVHDALVARRHPVADELSRRRLLVAPVFEEHHRIGPRHRDLPFLARPAAAVRADDRDVMARHRQADRARAANADDAAGTQHEIAFGLAVEFVDRDAERLAAHS